MMSWLLLSFFLAGTKVSPVRPAPVSAPAVAGSQTSACRQSPTEDLLPDVVGPMTGARPVWLVDGSAVWRPGEPVKTVWVLLRTPEEVRIEGRRLDAPGVLTLRRGDDAPATSLVIANPARQSVIPGGAPPEVMRAYAFLTSHVFYPSPGCWEFTVRIGQQTSRIVRDLEPASGAGAK
jgi:hypothetical protein